MSTQALIQLMPLVLLIIIMYFLLIRPQKKREKSINAMRNAIKIGDEIITIGGICGKVVKTKDEKLTIEVGSDKTKFEIMRWAVSKIVNAVEEPSKTVAPKAVKGKRANPKAEKTVAAEKEAAPKTEAETEVEVEAASETDSDTEKN